MKERPIIFSGPMVRAILEGRKTQTRRVVTEEWNHGLVASKDYPYKKRKFKRRDGRDDFVTFSDPHSQMFGEPIWFYSWGNARWLRCPYGAPGDRLWVRETWAGQHNRPLHEGRLFYRADGEVYGRQEALSYVEREKRWRSPLLLPRWASRLTLEVKSIRVERVQEISEAGAKAEGVKAGKTTDGGRCYALGFSDLWDSINEKRGYPWSSNPWVWVVEFEKLPEPAGQQREEAGR